MNKNITKAVAVVSAIGTLATGGTNASLEGHVAKLASDSRLRNVAEIRQLSEQKAHADSTPKTGEGSK